MLLEMLELENAHLFENLLPVKEKLIWNEDKLPPHYETIERGFLNVNFEKWI